MLKQIRIDQIKPGMHIHDLNVVWEQNENNLPHPVVNIFYHAGQQHYLWPELIDLAKTQQDRISNVESYEKWNIDPYQCLPG